MLLSIVFHAVSAWFAFFLPAYSTFKALKHRPLSEPALEHWATYWVVMGMFVAVEFVAEWIVSWVPFYWEIKTVFLLYCSLPQFQGSVYLYQTHLEPIFTQNEARIDAAIASAQSETLTFLRAQLTNLMEIAFAILSKTPVTPKRPDPSPAGGQNGYPSSSSIRSNGSSTQAPPTPAAGQDGVSGYNLNE